MITTIDRVQEHVKKLAAGEIEKVQPGMEVAFTAACQPDDCIRQGDLYLTLVPEVPAKYRRVKTPEPNDLQLVPGQTTGSKHCLDSFDGVQLHRPEVWNDESLDGPCLVLTKDQRVRHPIHGTVILLAGTTVLCTYQREYDKELKKEARARD